MLPGPDVSPSPPKLDLLLINPSRHASALSLPVLAAYMRKNGYGVEILDGLTQDVKKELEEKYSKMSLGVIGITATTDAVMDAFRWCEFIKKNFPEDILCVLGGMHATALPKRSLEESMFDLVVVGEGELTMLEVMEKHFQKSFPADVAGTVVRTEKGIVRNPPRPLIKDLDEIPLPAYDLIDEEYYIDTLRGYGGGRSMVIMASRGCPFRCVFCSSEIIWHRKVRYFSADRIIKEIKFLIENFNINQISFLDDMFTASKKKLSDVCERLISEGISKKIAWSCQVRTDMIDVEKLKMMKKAGCFVVRMGMESASQKSLSFLKFDTTSVDLNQKGIDMCHEVGLRCYGSFIIGSPDENLDDMIETIEFIERSGIDNADVYVVVPYPKTPLWDIAIKRGYLKKDATWNDFVVRDGEKRDKEYLPVIRNKYFSPRQLKMIKDYTTTNVTDPLNYYKLYKNILGLSIPFRKKVLYLLDIHYPLNLGLLLKLPVLWSKIVRTQVFKNYYNHKKRLEKMLKNIS